MNLHDLETMLNKLGQPHHLMHVHQGSYKQLKQMLTLLQQAEKIEGSDTTEIPKRRRDAVVRLLERLNYGVTETHVYMWDRKGGHKRAPFEVRHFSKWIGTRNDGTYTEVIPPPDEFHNVLKDSETIYRRPHFMQRTREDKVQRKEVLTGDPVWHIEMIATRSNKQNKERLKALVNHMREHGWIFLGCKNKGTKPIAVFGQGDTLSEALENICGPTIAREITRHNLMKRIQNLVIMLCRVGWGPRFETEDGDYEISFDPIVRTEPEWDGVILGADHELSDLLRDWFMMPADTKRCAGSYFGEAWSKGTILLDQPYNFVCEETVKLGAWTDTIDISKLIIHEMDSLALSKTKKERLNYDEFEDDTFEAALLRGKTFYAGHNLGQEFVYNYTEEEQQKLLENVFTPAIALAGNLANRFQSLKNVDRLIAMNVRVDDIDDNKIRTRLRTWTLQTLLNPSIPGMYVMFTPDPKLKAFKCRVPEKAKKNDIRIGDKVCITRHPCLPVGNATQVYTVVGYTDGNYAEVGPDPWMSIQGGDFDGDLGRISKWLHDLFPDKQWDQTPMEGPDGIAPPKLERLGVRSKERRIEQGTRVMLDEIGKNDFAARHAWENGLLDRGARFMLSRQIQACVMGLKHDVVVPNIDKDLEEIAPSRDPQGNRIQYATGVVKNAVNESRKKLLHVTKDLPYHNLFVQAFKLVDQPLPKDSIDKGILKGRADTIPEDDLFSVNEWRWMRTEGREAAKAANKRFWALWNERQPDLQYMVLADTISIHLEKRAQLVASLEEPRTAVNSEVLEKRRLRAARAYLLLQLGGMCKWRLICRLSLPGWEDLARSAVNSPEVVEVGAELGDNALQAALRDLTK